MGQALSHGILPYTEGAKKMYTHFKRGYLCKMCIHFFGTLCIFSDLGECQFHNYRISRPIRRTFVPRKM